MNKPKKKKFSAQEFVQRYREIKNWDKKIKALGNLSESNRKSVVALLSPQEVKEYKKMSSALIERRYDCIKRNKPCLDAVTAKNPNIKEIYEKYYRHDLSIPVYTIKAIINAYEGIAPHITKDDGKYSENADKYYEECKRYWDIIQDRWDTDTGVYSKEEIEKGEFSEYHINANKVKTILKQLKAWKKEQYTNRQRRNNNRGYGYYKVRPAFINTYPQYSEWNNTPENKKWYHINKDGVKSRVSSVKLLQDFLDRDYQLSKGTCEFRTHTTLDGITLTNLNPQNYKYIRERDKMLIEKGYVKKK